MGRWGADLNGLPICCRANANMRRSAPLLQPRDTYEYSGLRPVRLVTSTPVGSLKIRTTLVIDPSSRASSPIASSTWVYAERCAAAASRLSAGSFHHCFPTR